MLEIEEMMPFYICKKDNVRCNQSITCGGEDCNHTTFPIHAKNTESIELFNRFFDTFHVCVDDYGRLVCTEKEGQSNDG